MTVPVLIQRLDDQLPLPSYEHPGDAAMDLRARSTVTLAPGERVLVPTGIAIALPPGYAGFIHPRSGLALKRGLGMVNAPGVIDAGYRGEIGVIVINHDRHESITLVRGDRIAQLVIAPVTQADLIEVTQLPGSHRGQGGFGSTGTGATTVDS
jgi:dUTP pyrophosphatase